MWNYLINAAEIDPKDEDARAPAAPRGLGSIKLLSGLIEVDANN